jgi:EmrB/QacA subfamily drug resistance transporter
LATTTTTATQPGTSPGNQVRSTGPAGETPPHRWLLPVVLTGVFMGVLDFFIVNVAIPTTQRDLRASAAAIQFVVAGYGLAYGAGLITGGRLGDLYGRRRMFAIGMALFVLTSAACGLAPTAGVLVAARIMQGVAAALLVPQVLAIIGTAYPGAARARALNAYGLTLGLAAVFGQLIGGVLIQANVAGLGWRTCFLINLPIGLAALALTRRAVPESRSPHRSRLDLTGTLLITLALTALVLPLVEGRQQGWPLWSWLSLAAAGPAGIAFVLQQRRAAGRGGAPLVDLSLFRERAFTAGLLTQLVFFAGMASFFLVFALYVQQGRHLDALQAGLIFVPIGGGYLATSLASKRLSQLLGRQVIAAGGLVMGLALVALKVTADRLGTGGNITWLIPSLLLDGAGMGLAIAPLAGTVLSRVRPEHAGAASGVLATTQQVGNALGVAVLGVVFFHAAGQRSGEAAVPHAFAACLPYLMGVAVAVIGLTQLLPGRRPRS